MAESAPVSRGAPDQESDQSPESPSLSVTPSEGEEEEEEEEAASQVEDGPCGETRRPRPVPARELPPGRRRKSSRGERVPCAPQDRPLVLPPWPPAPLCLLQEEEEEEEALATMLMSWYLSGYHTGFYVGVCKGRAAAAALLPGGDCGRRRSGPRS